MSILPCSCNIFVSTRSTPNSRSQQMVLSCLELAPAPAPAHILPLLPLLIVNPPYHFNRPDFVPYRHFNLDSSPHLSTSYFYHSTVTMLCQPWGIKNCIRIAPWTNQYIPHPPANPLTPIFIHNTT